MAHTSSNLFESAEAADINAEYPLLRYMGSKYKLIPWIQESLSNIKFDSALDAFSGSGVVSYLFKRMGKRVHSNDFLHFSALITKALIENNEETLSSAEISQLLSPNDHANRFIQNTFRDVFYEEADLEFLDNISFQIQQIRSSHKRALAYTALFRSCLKKQPRGVFTISGDLSKYDDGRRDLRLSLRDHFIEQIHVYNEVVFDNQQANLSFNSSVFDLNDYQSDVELVYLDPPYVPKSDDNCYVKRYHFLEGLSKYWEGEEIMRNTKVKKIKKKYTPFSYRKSAIESFDLMFKQFQDKILVLSYSSNAYPDLNTLVQLMRRYKNDVQIKEKSHLYNFGNHSTATRNKAVEYLIIGQD